MGNVLKKMKILTKQIRDNGIRQKDIPSLLNQYEIEKKDNRDKKSEVERLLFINLLFKISEIAEERGYQLKTDGEQMYIIFEGNSIAEIDLKNKKVNLNENEVSVIKGHLDRYFITNLREEQLELFLKKAMERNERTTSLMNELEKNGFSIINDDLNVEGIFFEEEVMSIEFVRSLVKSKLYKKEFKINEFKNFPLGKMSEEVLKSYDNYNPHYIFGKLCSEETSFILLENVVLFVSKEVKREQIINSSFYKELLRIRRAFRLNKLFK